jgi:universal stress protein A
MNPIDIDYRKILCPVDFSESGRKAFYKAVGLARLFEAELHIVHVSEWNFALGGYEEVEEEAAATERLEAGIRRRLDDLQADGLLTDDDRKRMTLEILGGRPWRQVVQHAMDQDVDLIVLATRGAGGLKQSLIGGQAERIARRAGCTVHLVKPDGYRPEFD